MNDDEERLAAQIYAAEKRQLVITVGFLLLLVAGLVWSCTA